MATYRVLCISGSGRTGSTLLSILLSQNADCFNLGQSRDLWKAYRKNDQCSCEQTVKNCSVWKEVIGNLVKEKTDFKVKDVQNDMRQFIDRISTLSVEEITSIKSDLRDQHTLFLSSLRVILDTCHEISGAQIFVDSSKSPEIALAFSLLENTEVYLLNLVRDPRAVAVSWAKKHDAKTIKRLMTLWKSRQQRLKAWKRKRLIEHYVAMRYEDFTRDPKTCISQIQLWLGSDNWLNNFSSDRETIIGWQGQHLFPPTNETILQEKRPRIVIEPANAWKEQKSILKLAALYWTFPESLLYLMRYDDQEYIGGS